MLWLNKNSQNLSIKFFKKRFTIQLKSYNIKTQRFISLAVDKQIYVEDICLEEGKRLCMNRSQLMSLRQKIHI